MLTLSSDTKKGNPDPVAHATPRTDDARSKSALIRSDAQQSGAGTRLNHHNVSTTFAGLLGAAGITAPPGRRRPRPYDLRHSFAVATLISWHADGADVQSRLPALSTYLGHVKPSATYWYLQAAPELLAVAAARLERFLGDLP